MKELHPSLHPIKFQRTFCMVKPDGVMRGLIGDIINRIERAGLKVVALKMIQADDALIRQHLPIDDQAWVDRLGTKSLSGFANLDIVPKDVLGSEDISVIGEEVKESIIKYLISGPTICMVVEGIQAIEMVRKLAGNTLPFKADVGTIRGDYSVDSPAIANAEGRSIHNLVHASENEEEATNEIRLWFKKDEVHNYSLPNEAISYGRYY